jgi:WD40 repeat protein
VIACGDDGGVVYVVREKDGVHWDVLPLEKKHDKQVSALAFSSNGKWLLSGGRDGKVLVWDVSKGALSRTLSELAKPIQAVALSADGRHAMAGSDDGSVYFWELNDSDAKEIARHHTDAAVLCLALTKDDRFLFSGGRNGAIRRWDVREPSKESRPFGALEHAVEAVVLSPDDHFLYSGDLQGNIKRWNTDRENPPHSLEGRNDLILSLAISPNGKSILSGQAAGRLTLIPIEAPPGASAK